MLWWSQKLGEVKGKVATLKNRVRCAAPVRRQKVVEEYLKQKEEYETAATTAQVDSWKEFCGKQDRKHIWEGIYRVIGRTTRGERDYILCN